VLVRAQVKLWNLPQSPAPLLQFASPSYDYVTDVRWSPTHPAVFATIASGGDLALWNLAKSVSEPVETLRVAREDDGAAPGPGGAPAAAGAGAGAGAGTSALNKLLWARDGRALYVGDAKGAVHVVGVGEAAVKASAAEESAFEAALPRATAPAVAATVPGAAATDSASRSGATTGWSPSSEGKNATEDS